MKWSYILSLFPGLTALIIWLMTGAWENGAMPDKGVITISILSFTSLACFYFEDKFK